MSSSNSGLICSLLVIICAKATGSASVATGLPPSTCQRLVRNLVLEGFLDRDDDRYRIGLDFVQWAAPGTFGLDIVPLTRPALLALRDRTGETACLYVRHGPFRTVVSIAESRHPVVRLFALGMVMPLHAGSAERCYLVPKRSGLVIWPAAGVLVSGVLGGITASSLAAGWVPGVRYVLAPAVMCVLLAQHATRFSCVPIL